MGYGSHLYRRPSGHYVFRLSVPEAQRHWFAHGEVHQSTRCRDRVTAALIALQLRHGWASIFQAQRTMDLTAIERGSPLLVGGGFVSITDVALTLGADAGTVALELANHGAKFCVFADAWRAVSYQGPLCILYHEDGEVPFVEIENVGEDCVLRGVVELADSESVGLRLKRGDAVVKPYEVVDPGFGRCFISPFDHRIVDRAHLYVPKPAVTAWLASVKAVVVPNHVPTITVPSGAAAMTTVASVMVPQLVASTGVQVESLSAASTLPSTSTPVSVATAPVAVAPTPVSSRFALMKMSDLAEKFVSTMSATKPGSVSKWKPEEAQRNRNKLAMFCDLTGNPTMGELEMVPESETIVEGFLARASEMPTGPALTKARAATDGTSDAVIAWANAHGVTERMNLQTVKRSYLAKVSECLRWAQKKGYIKANPCANVFEETQLDPNTYRQKRRVPLSSEELRRVFEMAWFRAGGPPRTVAGNPAVNFRPYHYWLPLLGLYVGGRINELSQLYLGDLKVTPQGSHYIAFTLDRPDKMEDVDEDDEPFEVQAAGDKSLKTVNAVRDMPVHDELIRLGLINYANALRKAGYERLFPELRHDKAKGYGAEPRKWFNDRLLGNTLKIPRDGTRVFHSLRHNFVVAARHAGVALRAQQQLIGHKRGGHNTTEEVYDHDDDVDMLRPGICRITHPIPAIAPFDAAAGLQAVRYAIRLKETRARLRSATTTASARDDDGVDASGADVDNLEKAGIDDAPMT